MDERLRFVARLLEGEQMTHLCREFGISRKTGYKIFDRYKEHGHEALTDRSRRPVRSANQLPGQVESLIVSFKREKPHWGARKIRELLLRRLAGDVRVPAISTIHAVLDRHGLVKRMNKRRQRASGTPLSAGLAPNDLWCADYKGEFQLGNRTLMKRADQDIGPFLDKVRPMLAAVKAEGDQALARYAREFDKADVPVDRILVREQEFEDAYRMLDPAVREAIEVAVKAIRTFHEEQLPEPMWLKETSPGAFAGDRWHPIASVGLYVPRGKGSFPSVTMMTAIPAIVAGVPEIAIFTPPAPDGTVDAGVLVAAKLVGVKRIYKCGGSQAIAAAAYGTETVRKVLKIVGPGSPWVVAAKRLLSDVVDVGLPAGPSEAIIFADESADGRMAGLDLLIEAEHGPDSSAYLVTNSRKVAEDALAALPDYWAAMTLPNRVEFSKAVVTGPRGGIVLVRSIQEAYDFINEYAPEHLEVLSSEPFKHLAGIINAAEVLLGSRTPVTIANFMLGPNGVLPTGGWARTFGPLSVTDYMKRSSIGYVTSVGYPGLARRSKLLAEYEGFSSHANAVSEIRDRLLEGSTA